MLTLYLLRHAKSNWDDPERTDFDRPLAARGRKAAPKMGLYMAHYGVTPQEIICSSAVRARETLGLILPHLRVTGDCIVRLEKGLYEAKGADALIRRLKAVQPGPRRLLIVGHNPSLQDLALMLASPKEASRQLEALHEKFPTCGLAVLRFKLNDWDKIAPGAGILERFITSKTMELPPEEDT